MEGTEIKGCPWCGGKPLHEVIKHHNCGEPYYQVKLYCRPCAVSMSSVASDAECDEASDVNRQRYAEGKPLVPHADGVARIVIKNRLLPRWNARAQLG